MPDIITPGLVPSADRAIFGATWKDLTGRTRSTSLDNPGEAAASAFSALVAASAALSNASPVELRGTVTTAYDDADPDWYVYDDAHAGVDTVAVFVAEDFASGDVQRWEVPAIDVTHLASGSDSIVDLGDANVVTMVSALQAYLNADGDNYTVKRAFLSSRSRRAAKSISQPRVADQIAEPSGTGSPGAGPGELELPSV